MKFTTATNVFALCLLVGGGQSSLLVRSEKIGSVTPAAAMKRFLLTVSPALGSEKIDSAIASRKLQASADDDDDAIMQCYEETGEFVYGTLGLEDELDEFADSQVKTEKYFDEMDITESESSLEARQKLQSVCLDAGGYYVEASDPITCTLEIFEDNGTDTITAFVQKYTGAADCVANTETCKSVDPVLDFVATFLKKYLGGECHYEKAEDNQRRTLRGKM